MKINAVKKAFSFFNEEVEVKGVRVPSGVSKQPIGEETIKGAMNRAKNSLKVIPDAEFGIGIEAGLFPMRYAITGYMDFQWCVIMDRR